MSYFPDGALSRDEVAELLRGGIAWRIRWCPGARVPDTFGAGAPLPGRLEHGLPSPAKLRSGRLKSRTYTVAVPTERDGKPFLEISEGFR